MATNSVTLHRVLRSPADRIYRAFLEPEALQRWLPPFGFTGKVHSMDPVVGGSWHMSFMNFSAKQSHSFGGKYLELVPGELISYTSVFDDENLKGTMTTTIKLKSVFCGTDFTAVQSGIPELIPVEMCYLGWQQSLVALAQLVEQDIPG